MAGQKANGVIGRESVATNQSTNNFTSLPTQHAQSISPRDTMPTVHLLDYVAGNVRSLVNAIEKVGYTVVWVRSPQDVAAAEVKPVAARTPCTRCFHVG